MAATTPASALSKSDNVTVKSGRPNASVISSGIEVALQAEGRIAFGEHLLIHGAVGIVAGGATFLDRIMGEDKWSDLRLVTLIASFIFAIELGAAAFEGRTLVRIVAITAAHLAAEHRVTIGQHELRLFIQVALEAGFRGFLGIDDGASAAAGFLVFAARAMAGFAAHIDGVFTLGLKLGMICRAEIATNLFVTRRALTRADEGGTRNAGRGHHCASGSTAGNQDQRHRGPDSCTPHEVALFVTNPTADGRGGRKFPEGLH